MAAAKYPAPYKAPNARKKSSKGRIVATPDCGVRPWSATPLEPHAGRAVHFSCVTNTMNNYLGHTDSDTLNQEAKAKRLSSALRRIRQRRGKVLNKKCETQSP